MKNELFDELLASVQEMDEVVQGKKAAARVTEFPEPEVKLIREKVGLSQNRFALLIGVSKRTLENWEQGRAKPNAQAALIIRVSFPRFFVFQRAGFMLPAFPDAAR